MKIEDFIVSGVLEDYCLGLLSIEKQARVEHLSREYPAVANELRRLQQGLENYVGNSTSRGNAELKNKIWKEIEELNTDETHSG